VPLMMPLVKFEFMKTITETDPTGYDTNRTYVERQYSPMVLKDATRLSFLSVPQLLNETDVTVNASLWISLNRQTYYLITDKETELTYFDSSRLVYGNVITIGTMRGRGKIVRKVDEMQTATQVIQASTEHFHLGRRGYSIGLGPDINRDVDKFFVIRSQHDAHIPDGRPIVCGSTIRLMHHVTLENLKAWASESATSHQNEVTLNGHVGAGDRGDNWVIQCEGGTQMAYHKNWKSLVWDKILHRERSAVAFKEKSKYWKQETPFRLWHPSTNTYLNIGSNNLPGKVCSSCSRKQLREVTAESHTRPGNELSFRWYVKQALNVPFECDTPKQHAKVPTEWGMYKSWSIYRRPIRIGDFVAWRNLSSAPCDNLGRTQIGQVTQIANSKILTVDEWFQVSYEGNSWARRIMSPLPDQQILRGYRLLRQAQVHGPLVNMWELPNSTAYTHAITESLDDLTQVMPQQRRAHVKLYVKHVDEGRKMF